MNKGLGIPALLNPIYPDFTLSITWHTLISEAGNRILTYGKTRNQWLFFSWYIPWSTTFQEFLQWIITWCTFNVCYPTDLIQEMRGTCCNIWNLKVQT